jgi:hypothetical protein
MKEKYLFLCSPKELSEWKSKQNSGDPDFLDSLLWEFFAYRLQNH